MNLADWNLAETHSDKKPARTDHFFEWEQKAALDPASGKPAAEGAHIRMQLQVQGEEVSGYRIFIKIPETWRDAESRRTPAQLAQSFGRAAVIGVALIAVLVIFLRSLKSPEVTRVPWRPIGKLSILMLFAAIVIYANREPQLLANYTTSWPLSTFCIILFISMIFIVAIYMAAAVLLVGLAWFFLERAFGPGRISPRRDWNAGYFRDSFCLALFGSPALMGVFRLPADWSRAGSHYATRCRRACR